MFLEVTYSLLFTNTIAMSTVAIEYARKDTPIAIHIPNERYRTDVNHTAANLKYIK